MEGVPAFLATLKPACRKAGALHNITDTPHTGNSLSYDIVFRAALAIELKKTRATEETEENEDELIEELLFKELEELDSLEDDAPHVCLRVHP